MWMIVTVAAAIFQTSRTAMQQRLRSLLSVSGAGFVRYVWGAPIALAAVAVIAISGQRLPSPPARFWPLIAGGGIAQIVATILLISAFDSRGFAVGTVYSKTEVVQVAVFSAVLLDETLRPLGWLSTVLCMAGVVLLAGGRTLLRNPDRAALLGLFAGTGFGLAAVGIRAATQSLGDSPAIVRAVVALAVMNTMQTIIHGGYLTVREREQLGLAFRHWRSSSVVGMLSVCGSACWAWAFALQNAARVRTFGQIELLFTLAVAHWWLHERNTRREFAGAGLVLAGVLGVMLAG
ncbi:MAG: DMT family transporter [Ilumatobacteraceae bacterium]